MTVRDADGADYQDRADDHRLVPLRRDDDKPSCDGTHSKICFAAADASIPDLAEVRELLAEIR